MRKNRIALPALAVLLIASAALAQVPAQQAAAQPAKAWPQDMKKLFQEIAGDYVFDMGGSTQTIQFLERDGALFGAPYGETEEAVVPVKDKPYHFEVTVQSNGNFFQLEFVRDDKGAFIKCILNAEGMTLEGLKQIKS